MNLLFRMFGFECLQASGAFGFGLCGCGFYLLLLLCYIMFVDFVFSFMIITLTYNGVWYIGLVGSISCLVGAYYASIGLGCYVGLYSLLGLLLCTGERIAVVCLAECWLQ